MRERKRGPLITAGDRRAGLVVMLLPLVLVAPAWMPGRVFAPCDILAQADPWRTGAGGPAPHNPAQVDAAIQFHPWLLHASREVRAGRFPLWNPYAMCGAPFLANPQTSVLSPFCWPAYLVSPAASLWIASWLLMAVAGLGLHGLLRTIGVGPLAACAGAVAYQWCGWNMGWLRDTPAAVSAWFPWLLMLVERLALGGGNRTGAGLALVVGAQFLGGHPETSCFVLLGTAAFVLWRARRGGGLRMVARTAGWGAVGAVLAAVLLLPFLDEVWSSQVLDLRLAGANPGLPPRALLELLVPLYHGGPMAPPAWDRVGAAPVHAVAGAGALVWGLAPLVLGGPRGTARAFGAFFVSLAAAGVAVSIENPLTGPLLARVPPFSVAVNSFALLYVALAGAALTGLGLDALLTSAPGRRALRWSVAAGTGAAVMAVAAFVIDLPRMADARAVGAVAARVSGFLAVSAFGAGLIALGARRSRARVPAALGLALLQWLSLVPYALRTHGTSTASLFYRATPALQYLGRVAGSDRVLLTMPNTGVAFGLREATGFDAFGHARLAGLLGAPRSAITHGPGPLWFRQPAASPLLDLLALRYVLLPPDGRLDAPGLHAVLRGPDAAVYRNDQALPRARAVGGAVFLPDPVTLAARMRAGLTDPRRLAYVEGSPGASGEPAAFPPVAFEADEPQRVVLRARSPRAGWLVLTDSWAPGWIARVNGRRVGIRRADVAFRAVPLPRGDARVEFDYVPRPFRIGLWLSAAALGVLGLSAARPRRGRSGSPGP